MKREVVWDDKEFERIKRECFWDIDITKEEFISILKGNNVRAKKFLFQKIFANSQDILKDLKLFSKEDIREFLEEVDVRLYSSFLSKRKKVLERLLLGKDVKVKVLEWR